MDLLLTMRDGTRYRGSVESVQAALRFNASQGAVSPAQGLTVLSDVNQPVRQVRWLNAAEVVEISEVPGG